MSVQVHVHIRDTVKVSKPTAKYSDEGTDAEHCAICAHYEKLTACEIVTSPISWHGWCRYFKKA